jgi:outer membrane biosynthesis protein TonB
MLTKIKALLSVVKLAEAKLENGTVIEAEAFEAGQAVFIVSDEERVPLPIGNYTMESGDLLMVQEEGMISSVTPSTELADEEIVVEAPEEVVSEVEAIVEAVVEVITPVIEEVKSEIEELKKKFSKLEEQPKEEEAPKEEKKEEMSRKFKHNPERKTAIKGNLSKNQGSSTLERVFNQLF